MLCTFGIKQAHFHLRK
uniref:Uncharacterized protein n=1 Tax=Anguilla anguilla TaxID=7936 RepID=A0A0E9VL02_ANGAN